MNIDRAELHIRYLQIQAELTCVKEQSTETFRLIDSIYDELPTPDLFYTHSDIEPKVSHEVQVETENDSTEKETSNLKKLANEFEWNNAILEGQNQFKKAESVRDEEINRTTSTSSQAYKDDKHLLHSIQTQLKTERILRETFQQELSTTKLHRDTLEAAIKTANEILDSTKKQLVDAEGKLKVGQALQSTLKTK